LAEGRAAPVAASGEKREQLAERPPMLGALTAPIGPSPGQLVRRQSFDLLDVSGAATEAMADLGMVGATGSPFQDPAFQRTQLLRFGRDAGARYPGVGDHSADELGSPPEAARNLGFIDAIAHQAQDATLERPK
jgi:hypothetical protein